ncbi:MAG: acyl carrier protein [Planctomycetota bacterium]
MSDDKQQRVLEILAEVVRRPVGELRPDMKLKDDLELDSAQSLEFLCEVEEAFGVEIDEVAAAKVETIQDVLAFTE